MGTSMYYVSKKGGGRGSAKCLLLLTWGEGGLRDHAYVMIFGIFFWHYIEKLQKNVVKNAQQLFAKFIFCILTCSFICRQTKLYKHNRVSPFVSPVPRVGLPGGQMQGLVTAWWELVLHFGFLALTINTSDFSAFFIVLVPCSFPRWHKFWCL